MTFATISSYFKLHERLVQATIAGLVLWFSIGRFDTLMANHDAANLQQVKVTAAVQQSKNEATAALVAQQAADYKALNDKVTAQNTLLESANLQLVTELARQQHVDTTMTPTALTQRWNQLVPQASSTVTPSGISLPVVGAVATVQQLEEVPVLQQELTASQTETKNEQSINAASAKQIATLNTEVDGLNLQIVDDKKVCKAEVAVVKAEAKRSKRRWFTAGVVVGFAARQVVKTYLGF